MTEVAGLPLIKAFKSELFPLDRLDPGSDIGALLARILVTEYTQEVFEPGPGGSFELGLTVAEEAVINLVGLDGFAIVFGGASSTLLRVGAVINPASWEIRIGAGARLRFPRAVLKPVVRDGEHWVDDPSRQYAELDVAAGIIVDQDWNVSFDGANAFHLEPAMIADSGLVIEGDVALDLSETTGLPESAALGLPASWRGIVFRSLVVHLPEAVTEAVPIESLAFTNFHIGSGGVSGTVALNGTPGDGTIGGFPFRPTSLAVELRQNCLTQATIGGRLTLAFFDAPLDVTVGFDLAGNFTVEVASSSGLVTLEKPGILSASVDSLGFGLEDGVFTVAISGTLTPLIGGLAWPGFHLDRLSIDSEGHVRVEGGWINLPSQYSLDFFGFHVSITQLGLGSTDDDGKWIGFSGGIKFVDGLSIGGSVEGLKVIWYDDGRPPKLTLDGVGVELEIPEVLRFKGEVSYHELPGPQRRFDGAITLELLALGLRIDGKIVIGVDTNAAGQQYTFFALYVAVELPAGIPLWSTGLGLFGLAGLVAIQMAPNKGAAPNVLHPGSRTDEEWFENADGSPGWYKRDVIGVTDLKSKWDPLADAFAIGGGVTIGTVADNGFTFNGSLLLVISFPGPVILLEGKANLLKERASLTDDPIFRALVVLDFRAGNVLVGLMAHYKFGDGAELVDIAGSAEAFFDFNDASRWHLYLGVKDPKSRRIRASILSIFEADAYFMIDAERLQMGAWVGYDKHWDFGPLSVVVEAWIEGGVVISWKPLLFHGELWLHGKAELRVFGFGLGIHVDARFAADVFDPFHVLAEFSVGIDLPWPLPDFDVGITLEWGPTPDEPPLPVPLKEIAVEHFKSTASWPLPRGQLLVPATDDGNGFLALPVPTADLAAAPPAAAPVVPLDARPHITFTRAVHDDALVGVNPQPVWPNAVPVGWERLGDPDANQGPMRARFSLQELKLARWSGSAWVDVARKGSGANAAGVRELFGSWANVPQLPSGTQAPGTDPPVAQVKLWLWSKTPFDYSRHGGRAWDEWFTDAFTNYPCVPPVRGRTICCDFDDLRPGRVALPMPAIDHPEVLFLGAAATIEVIAPSQHGHRTALCWMPTGRGDTGRANATAASTMVDRRLVTPVAYDSRAMFAGILLTGESADGATLTFARDQHGRETCVDFEGLHDQAVKLPLTRDAMTIRVRDREGSELDWTDVISVAGRRAINLSFGSSFEFVCEPDRVEFLLWQGAGPVMITALGRDGGTLAKFETIDSRGFTPVTVETPGISALFVDAPKDETFLVEACLRCSSGGLELEVFAVDSGGSRSGPYLPTGDVVDVPVGDIRGVVIQSREPACLLEACFEFAPDATEVSARQDMAKRLSDSMALWGDEGEVLQPSSDYRLAVTTKVEAIGEGALSGHNHTYDLTELSYFKTQGPPALAVLSTPVNQPSGEAFDSGLNDLARYVGQTVPRTVPGRGEQPILPRPVYRAYDVGALFNEDYVDLMYRLAHRDLALYLYDSNNRPVRDLDGRVVVLENRWGHTEAASLSESTIRYLSVLDGSTCAVADPTIIPHQVTLSTAADLTLTADTVHEARLVPLLRHDDFRDGLGWWTVVDAGPNQAPSHWAAIGHPTLQGSGATVAGAVATLTGAGDLAAVDPATDAVVLGSDTARATKTYRVVAVDNATKKITLDGNPALAGGMSGWEVPGWGAALQTSNIWGGDTSATSPAKPGTMLIGGDAAWTDYRLVVQLRSSDDDAIGLVVRYQGPGDYYRYSMDRERRYRRLVRMRSGVATILAEDDIAYLKDQDYVITVEAIGDQLRVYEDGALVFGVTDGQLVNGRLGLYCWANEGARFSDVRVDDFRAEAPVAYRFPFTTSGFADFVHQLHSYEDRVWEGNATAGQVAAAAGAAVDAASAPTDAEARAYVALADAVLGAAASQPPKQTEIHRLSVGGAGAALLLRSPEPIDWKRTSLVVEHAPGERSTVDAPAELKLIDRGVGSGSPNDESITILARERVDLGGLTIDHFDFAGPLPNEPPVPLLEDDFGAEGGVLLEQAFGPNALDGYAIYDAPSPLGGPSAWSAAAGALIQSSNTYSGSIVAAEPSKLGTMAITGRVWRDTSTRATVRSSDDDAIGLVVRFVDEANWYRLSMDHDRAYRRFVKCVGGVVTVLWEDHRVYDINRAYELRIDAVGDLFIGYIDDVLLFAVHDAGVDAGQVGLYCWANVGARFEALHVESLPSSPIAFAAPLADVSELEVVDVAGAGAHDGPSMWSVASGYVGQTSQIHGDSPPPGIEAPGTLALTGPALSDADIHVAFGSSEPGAIGLVFRYADADNWYRFSMDRTNSVRRLVRCHAGVATVLWQDPAPFDLDRLYELTILAVGDRISIHLDGSVLVEVSDAAIAIGRVGFYCSGNGGATFGRLVITDPARHVGTWTVVDRASAGGPSTWRSGGGWLRQNSGIGSTTLPAADGSEAVTGSPSWRDYRISVVGRCDTGGAVGIVFRRRDRANWYRLSIDATHSYRRLVRSVAGVLTTIWEDSHAYDPGAELSFRVDAIGDRLVGSLGDEQLFDVVEPSHPEGAIGLYVSGAPGARFRRVVVETPSLDALALFRDRFAAGDLSAWTVVDEGAQMAPSAWHAAAGELRQTSNIYSDPVAGPTIERRGTFVHSLPMAFGDAVLSVRLTSDDDDAIGLMFRYQDPANYYRFSMDRERSYRRLVACTAGVFTTLWEDAAGFELGRPYQVVIATVGSRLTAWLDGLPLFDLEDATHANGGLGLYCWGNVGARFSAVRAYEASLLRRPDLLDDDLDQASPGRWTSVTTGDQQTPAAWGFAGGELVQTSNVWGGVNNAAELAKPGTVALLTLAAGVGPTGFVPGSVNWTDYRVSVALQSDDDDAIGIVFRYVDDQNWYRLSMDAERSYRRLVRCVAGAVTELWSDNQAYVVGRPYVMTIDAVGDALTGYLDGVVLFSVRDDALPSGTVGLYCWANTGARFRSIRVSSPAWRTYYRFGNGEGRAEAGSKVVVHSGNEDAWAAAPVAGRRDRFVAVSPDPGARHFSGVAPLRLRLKPASGPTGHARTFLPESAWTAVGGARVLRKADGTEFVVVIPSGAAAASALEPGSYRLTMRYRRNNTAAEPGSLVLSRGGDNSDEVLTIQTF